MISGVMQPIQNWREVRFTFYKHSVYIFAVQNVEITFERLLCLRSIWSGFVENVIDAEITRSNNYVVFFRWINTAHKTTLAGVRHILWSKRNNFHQRTLHRLFFRAKLSRCNSLRPGWIFGATELVCAPAGQYLCSAKHTQWEIIPHPLFIANYDLALHFKCATV